jgi:coenzyme F420-reducing hydrogenase delta subunit
LRKHVDQLKKDLSTYGVESLRLMSFSTTIPEYNKVINLFETFSTRIARMGSLRQEVRERIAEKVESS